MPHPRDRRLLFVLAAVLCAIVVFSLAAATLEANRADRQLASGQTAVAQAVRQVNAARGTASASELIADAARTLAAADATRADGDAATLAAENASLREDSARFYASLLLQAAQNLYAQHRQREALVLAVEAADTGSMTPALTELLGTMLNAPGQLLVNYQAWGNVMGAERSPDGSKLILWRMGDRHVTMYDSQMAWWLHDVEADQAVVQANWREDGARFAALMRHQDETFSWNVWDTVTGARLAVADDEWPTEAIIGYAARPTPVFAGNLRRIERIPYGFSVRDAATNAEIFSISHEPKS